MRGYLLCCTLTQSLLTILLGTLMEVLAGKGLRITFWLERILLPLSTMGQGREPTPSSPRTGGGLGRAQCPGRETPCPHSPVAHNGCFLPRDLFEV